MLRLVLQWFSTHEVPGHPLAFEASATWFSEALLPSPFFPRYRGDNRAEARTHADGIVGHVSVGAAGRADAALLPDASQLIVTEAKMFSPLSAGTKNAPAYDQAARNVACMAQMLFKAMRPPSAMASLGFFVLAPASQISEGGISDKLEKTSIENAVRSRAAPYSPDLNEWVSDWFAPTLSLVNPRSLSWEQLIADIQSRDRDTSESLGAF
jgi:hypothetical protein